ncbi:MAG: protease modulator HflC [Candidatus Binatia bacterium]
MKRLFAAIPLLVLALFVFLATGSLYFQVNEGEQAIVIQFGRPVGDPITEPGLYWKIPFVQEVRRFDKRTLTWDGDPNQIPTKGREFIWIDTTARWRIVDPRKFLESVATEDGARSRLDDIIDSVVRDQVSSSDLAELVRSSDWKVPEKEVLEKEAATAEQVAQLKQTITRGREEITRTILTEAQRLMPQYGIELVDVRIKRLNYIESVREKVYARMISERKRIAAEFRSEGEGESARILGTMEKELRDIRSSAYRRAQEIRGKADAGATTIYGEAYGKDPEFYAFSRTLEAYREGLNPGSTWILTTESDFYRYLKDVAPAKAGR